MKGDEMAIRRTAVGLGLVLAVALFSAHLAYGQTCQTAGDLIVPGKVGIGTTSPGYQLDVVQTGAVTNAVSYSSRIGYFSSGTIAAGLGAGLKFVAGTSTNRIEPAGIAGISTNVGAGIEGGALAFFTKGNGGGLTEGMRIDQGGNVGIGTTSPQFKLDVSGGIRTLGGGCCGAVLSVQNSDKTVAGQATYWNIYNMSSQSGYGDKLSFWAYNQTNTCAGGLCNERFAIHDNGNVVVPGNVGIGLSSPTYQLQLSTDSAAKPGTNTWTVASDARIKTGIREFTDGLAVVQGIRPVWYQYNGKGGFAADGKDHIGVIAQDIEAVAPYTVSTYKAKLDQKDTEDTQLLNFNSHALPFVLINAVKEQQAQIEELKAENTALMAALDALASRMAALEKATSARTK